MEKPEAPPIGELANSLILADEMVTKLQAKVMEQITVIETVKKIPEFNANMSVEMAFSCVWMNKFRQDNRVDESYLVMEDEPVRAPSHSPSLHALETSAQGQPHARVPRGNASALSWPGRNLDRG